MDYEKKYKEALKRATKAKNNASLSKGTLRVLGIIFPELAESEDERIRKKLIKYFQDLKGGWFGNISHDDILAWLEKQGEQKPKWTEEDERGSDETIELLEYFINYAPEFRKPAIGRSIAWLKSLKQRMGV